MTRFRRLRGERGSEAIQAVVLWPALLLIVWVIVSVVIYTLGRNVAVDSARAGLDEGRLPPVSTSAAQQAAVARATHGGFLSNVDARVVSDGQNVTVTVTGDATSLVPGLDLPVTQTASGPIEQLGAGARP